MQRLKVFANYSLTNIKAARLQHLLQLIPNLRSEHSAPTQEVVFPTQEVVFPTQEVVFPINRCILEIFISILQAVVDDEAARYDFNPPPRIVRSTAPATLALVCKSWKEVVYETSSLWAMIQLDLAQGKEVVKDRFERFIRRAKAGPVDLYLLSPHIHGTGTQLWPDGHHSRERCASTKEAISYYLDNIPNLRKLQMYSETSFIKQLILDDPPASVFNIRELVHYSTGIYQVQPCIYEVKDYLGRMHRLVNLWLNHVGEVRLDFCTSRPLLPTLKKLYLKSDLPYPVNEGFLPSFLSHTPNLEELSCWLIHFERLNNQYTFKPFILPQLSCITAQGMACLVAGFTDGLIKTPALKKFSHHKWSNQSNRWMIRFFKENPTLKDILLSVIDTDRYEEPLSVLNHLDVLTLVGDSAGAFLNPLTWRDDGPHKTLPVLARGLDKLIVMILRNSLELGSFEELVKGRCIPINVEGTTGAGCRAIDLELIAGEPDKSFTKIRDSLLWEKAEISGSKNRPLFHWKYGH